MEKDVAVQGMLEILKEGRGVTEAYIVHTFILYRRRKDGAVKEVTVQVRDAGSLFKHGRWSIMAVDEDRRIATGNASADLSTAIKLVHWWNLDE